MNRRSALSGLRHSTAAICLGTICLMGSWNALAREVQVGRYASLSPAPTEAQVHLLSTIVTVNLPARVSNVGGAVQHLLKGSGYRLAAEAAADPDRLHLLRLPLPEPHRHLGPMSLQDALETLGGPAYRLVEDPLHRLISFERCAVPGRAPLSRQDPDRS